MVQSPQPAERSEALMAGRPRARRQVVSATESGRKGPDSAQVAGKIMPARIKAGVFMILRRKEVQEKHTVATADRAIPENSARSAKKALRAQLSELFIYPETQNSRRA
jgi:hypothetical protein